MRVTPQWQRLLNTNNNTHLLYKRSVPHCRLYQKREYFSAKRIQFDRHLRHFKDKMSAKESEEEKQTQKEEVTTTSVSTTEVMTETTNASGQKGGEDIG